MSDSVSNHGGQAPPDAERPAPTPASTAHKQSAPAPSVISGRQPTAAEPIELQINKANARQVLDSLLRKMAASAGQDGKGRSTASDLHLNAGRPPDYRIDRSIRSVNCQPLGKEDLVHLSTAMMNENQRIRFEKNRSLDMSYHLGEDRFRVNIVQSFNGRSLSIRRFEPIQDFSNYHLPEQYLKIATDHRGFVVMSGSTGSGKTTSIAAMLDHVNNNYHRKIVTIEDPIEYVYTPKKSIVVQMEIGEDGIPDEDTALRNLVRMDPDVGLAGEMRDRQSLDAALKTAQAGHLIFGTLHCEGVGQAFDRILAYYDTSEHNRIVGTLADNLAAIINQRLLPCIREGISVIPAYEIFMPNSLTRRYIREKRYANAIEEMEKPSMKEIGCVTYVDSLYKLVTEEWVDFQVALEHAGEHTEKLASRVKGIELN